MRNKKLLESVLSLSLALALTTSVLPVSGATPIRDINKPTRLELRELEINKLKSLNGDKLIIKENDLKRIRKIDGKLTESKITTPDEAKLALKNVSNSLGIEDLDKEVIFSKSDSYMLNSTYDFKQYYEGLEVVNSCITLVVDNETNESEYLNSSFSDNISVDTTPTVTKEEAKDIVKEKYGIDVLDENIILVIYKEDETYTLAWKILTDSDAPSKVYLNAQTKEEITAVMHNVQKAYDFYKGLGLKGPNGKESRVYVYPECTSEGSSFLNNAYCSTHNNGDIRLSFGVGGDLTRYGARGNFGLDIDIVTHEFTHGVTNNLVNWGYRSDYKGEMMALHEAYSDIMGELCDDTREWQGGTDIYKDNTDKTTSATKKFYIRDLANPTLKYYTIKAEFDTIEGHSGSQVISHAAYLMKQNGVSINDLKNIWFNSLSYLPHGTSNVTFLDCREAVEKASLSWYLWKSYKHRGIIDYSYRNKNTAKVMSAFNAVRVYDPEYRIGDFNRDGKINSNDKSALEDYLKQSNPSPSLSQIYLGDLNFDGILDARDVFEYGNFGDVNLDGVVNNVDYTEFKSAYKNKLATWIPLQKYLADLNGDGDITTRDIYLLSEKLKEQE